MARNYCWFFLMYLILQFLLCTSHAYQHRHLRRTQLYQGHAHVVGSASSQQSNTKQQKINDLQAEFDKKLILKNSAIQLLKGEDALKEKRWGDHHHHHGNDDGSDSGSSTLEELQQKLDDLNQIIKSLYDLLSSSFGAHTGMTTSSATATSASTQYYTTSAPSTSTPIAYTTDASSNETATIASSSNVTASVSPTSAPTTSTAAHYAFDPMSSSNVAVYYGQTDQTSNVPLSTICADSDVDIIILAFVNKLSTGQAGYPTLNMGPHCWAATSAQVSSGATGLIDCVSDGFAAQVKSCQNTGRKVLLSIGGAVGYSETTIDSQHDAVRIADNIWNLFGAGGMDDEAIRAIRPFGDDVVFDGFDIDNEDGSTSHWPTLISTLRTHFTDPAPQQSSPSNNNNNNNNNNNTKKAYYLSAAPQCPLPDASIPLSALQTSIDFILIQFYNNPSCNLNSAGFLPSLQAWSNQMADSPLSNRVDVGNGVSSPRVFVGAPTFSGAGSGWVALRGEEEFEGVVGGVRGSGLANLGGWMFWDGAYGILSKDLQGGAAGGGTGRSYMRVAKEGMV